MCPHFLRTVPFWGGSVYGKKASQALSPASSVNIALRRCQLVWRELVFRVQNIEKESCPATPALLATECHPPPHVRVTDASGQCRADCTVRGEQCLGLNWECIEKISSVNFNLLVSLSITELWRRNVFKDVLTHTSRKGSWLKQWLSTYKIKGDSNAAQMSSKSHI